MDGFSYDRLQLLKNIVEVWVWQTIMCRFKSKQEEQMYLHMSTD